MTEHRWHIDGGILGGGIILLLGLIFLLGNFFPHIHIWRIIGNLWPLILIIIGLHILYNHTRFRRRKDEVPSSSFNRLIGEMNLSFNNQDIGNINASHLIGEMTIDLTGARLKGGLNNLNISQLIGETTIIIPPQIAMRITSKLLIGELHDNRRKEAGIMPRLENIDNNYELAEQKLNVIFSGLLGEMTLRRG